MSNINKITGSPGIFWVHVDRTERMEKRWFERRRALQDRDREGAHDEGCSGRAWPHHRLGRGDGELGTDLPVCFAFIAGEPGGYI